MGRSWLAALPSGRFISGKHRHKRALIQLRSLSAAGLLNIIGSSVVRVGERHSSREQAPESLSSSGRSSRVRDGDEAHEQVLDDVCADV
jgi:hypothetical protein